LIQDNDLGWPDRVGSPSLRDAKTVAECGFPGPFLASLTAAAPSP
jgi:hypothetical protein